MEPQLKYRPGYPIEKRGYYYLARRLSSQLSLVTENTDYGRLEKCYGIWICRDDIPVSERYSVSFYEIANTRNIGPCNPRKEDYDLMTLVLIRLGNKVYNGAKDDEGYDLLNFLRLIMYPHDRNFFPDMGRYIDFTNNPELWKEVNTVTGLGQCVYEDGVADGMERGMERGMEQGMAQGMARLNKLNGILVHMKRYADLERSTTDKEFQKKLLDELVPQTEQDSANFH